jgi:hypothetical protein
MGDHRVRHRPLPTSLGSSRSHMRGMTQHGSSKSGESESDCSGDNIDHHEICCPDAVHPIYKPSPESDPDGGREVFMVVQCEPTASQTTEEIA